MAKDLRGFLEPPRDVAKNKETQSSTPLAHRRGLTSPGEPRVFQVRSGYVCGLCGQVHRKLESAFDCLGRCTVQLRLRSPAGPSHTGSQAHFACTACGRGFANCDDAEQCFERCIQKLKPTKEFETALRRVQVKYAQRLASHGVRQLERIDPFKEHTKMLETLTKEQVALTPPSLLTGSVEQPAPVEEVRAEEREVQLARTEPEVSQPMSKAVSSELQPPEKQNESLNDAQPSAALSGDENMQLASAGVQGLEENLEHTAKSSAPIEETAHLTVDAEPAGDERMEPEAESDVSIDEHEQLRVEGELSSEENAASAVENLLSAGTNEQAAPQNESALLMLDEGAALIDDSEIGDAQPTAEKAADATDNSTLSSTSKTHSLDSLEMDDFASLEEAQAPNTSHRGLESSDFASIGNENETEAGLGEDVFAMLQDPPPKLDEGQKKQQFATSRISKNRIETDLLDDLSTADQQQDDFDKVYVRQPRMKAYRRDHAKYCCSACSKEFFTKEQVEACFYSHPEAGSEEERLLLEKIAKIKNKTAA